MQRISQSAIDHEVNAVSVSFATFADSSWVCAAERMRRDVETIQEKNHFFVTTSVWNEYDLGHDYSDRFAQYYGDHGFALWSWKPYVMRKALRMAEPGAFVLYLDGGCVFPASNSSGFLAGLRAAAAEMVQHGTYIGLTYRGSVPCERIVRSEILARFNLTDSDDFRKRFRHWQAGVALVRRSDEADDLLSSWYDFMSDNYESCIRFPYGDTSGQCNGFLHNGADQAVLQCLLYTSGIPVEDITSRVYDYGIVRRQRG